MQNVDVNMGCGTWNVVISKGLAMTNAPLILMEQGLAIVITPYTVYEAFFFTLQYD